MIIPVCDEHLIDAVALLAAEIWTEHYTPIIGPRQVEYMLDKFQSSSAISKQISENFLYYKIEINDQHVGYFGLEPKNDQLFLSKLYVRSSHRGKGFGSKALEFIENLAIQQGLKKIVLTVNKHNSVTIEKYLKMGFRNIGPIVTDIGNGYVMGDFILEKFLHNSKSNTPASNMRGILDH